MPEQSLVMVPLSEAQLAILAAGEALSAALLGIAANRALAATFGVEDSEQAETAALQLADVAGLTGFEAAIRIVVVASVAAHLVPDEADNGLVIVDGLNPTQVQAFFTGACDDAVARQAQGLSLDEAWALPAVQDLLGRHPLAWHDATELSGSAEFLQP